MAKIVNFSNNNDNDVETNLYDWTGREGELGHISDEQMEEVFLNMDIAMKYVHKHGYCVKSFSPLEIQILNNSPKQIKFNTLLEMPQDFSIQERLKKEDIFHSACLQIGLYTNSLRYLKEDFLKENFEEFAKNLPQGDVPYYRGVIQRGAGVYYSEYLAEKKKKDLENLEREVAGSEGKNSSKQLVKSNGLGFKDEPLANDKINDNIYKQINGLKDTAFINYLIIPTIILITGIAVSLLALLLSLF